MWSQFRYLDCGNTTDVSTQHVGYLYNIYSVYNMPKEATFQIPALRHNFTQLTYMHPF
jgi:hypothetical protein